GTKSPVCEVENRAGWSMSAVRISCVPLSSGYMAIIREFAEFFSSPLMLLCAGINLVMPRQKKQPPISTPHLLLPQSFNHGLRFIRRLAR
ncbi:MAG TPA: hypothetical protein VK110_04010, partial [Salinisphaeraceae bacterium]|nr:hypothetical protein [Salinisphaeraceae bacterium]